MNTDFRVEVGFHTHYKTTRLIALLGLDAAWSLTRLWAFAAQNRPDGNLIDMDAELIAAAAGWPGDAAALRDALLRLRWLDERNPDGSEGPYLHAWHEHQPHVIGAKERSEAARKAAEARWNPPKNARRMRAASDAQGNAETENRNAPTYQPTYQPTDPPTGRGREEVVGKAARKSRAPRPDGPATRSAPDRNNEQRAEPWGPVYRPGAEDPDEDPPDDPPEYRKPSRKRGPSGAEPDNAPTALEPPNWDTLAEGLERLKAAAKPNAKPEPSTDQRDASERLRQISDLAAADAESVKARIARLVAKA